MESDTFYRYFMAELVQDFHGENVVNLITRMVSMEIAWRQSGE